MNGDWSGLDRAELERRHREACDLLLASEQRIGRLASELEHVNRKADALASDLDVERRRVAEREAQLAERDAQLVDVVASASWQLTRPLRTFKSRLREPEA